MKNEVKNITEIITNKTLIVINLLCFSLKLKLFTFFYIAIFIVATETKFKIISHFCGEIINNNFVWNLIAASRKVNLHTNQFQLLKRNAIVLLLKETRFRQWRKTKYREAILVGVG